MPVYNSEISRGFHEYMISAKIIQDSITKHNHRLTTIEFVAPRFILAQFNTHRVFSRNAASSRAIPTKSLIQKAVESPVIPVWNTNKPGMQGEFDVTLEQAAIFEEIWMEARDCAVEKAQKLYDAGGHKQFVNRILEPFLYFKGVVTSTDWDNFFNLRIHEGAQPEIELLAKEIRNALNSSSPTLLGEGEWHMPYVIGDEIYLPVATQIKISVARCARVSYRLFDTDKISTLEKDIELYNDLFSSKHMSPMEHQATPVTEAQWNVSGFKTFNTGNFVGWNQYRKQIELN